MCQTWLTDPDEEVGGLGPTEGECLLDLSSFQNLLYMTVEGSTSNRWTKQDSLNYGFFDSALTLTVFDPVNCSMSISQRCSWWFIFLHLGWFTC